MIFFYIPFFYTFHTRLCSLNSKFAWFTTYVIPVFIACLYFKFDYFFSFLLISSIYVAYEFGYIFNDCELVKKEKDPTLRLNNYELDFYERKKWYILIVRSLILFFLLFVVFCLYGDLFFLLIISVFLILFTYTVYNSIRNNLNLPLYSFLVFCRYFIIFVLISENYTLAFFLYLVYPLCVTLEFSTKKRFKTSKFIKFNNFDKFRSFYYIILLIVAIIFYIFSHGLYTDLFLYLSFYFCIYRLLSYFFLSRLIRSE